MPVFTIHAPAKINLFLEVLRKRPDAYHDILTVFLKVGLYDTISFRLKPSGISVGCAHPQVPADERNIAWQAARLVQKEIATRQGVHIQITKRIPVGAGMGGGSSNAAAVLRCLPRLWDTALPEPALRRMAAGLGADVPFFLLPAAAAIGRGRGDRLQPLTLTRQFWLVLADPGIFVSTRRIYEQLGGRLTNKRNDVTIFTHALKSADAGRVAPYLFNRLEQVVFEQHPQIRTLKETLAARGARAALMSGSGSVVFALMSGRTAAERMVTGLRGSVAAYAVRSLS